MLVVNRLDLILANLLFAEAVVHIIVENVLFLHYRSACVVVQPC